MDIFIKFFTTIYRKWFLLCFKQGRLSLLINVCSLLATSCLPRTFFMFFIILEKHDSYITLNCFSMNLSLVTHTTIRMSNFLIINVFNLWRNHCKCKTEKIWECALKGNRMYNHMVCISY